MKRISFLMLTGILIGVSSVAQNRPKLVVGVVVDQMRQEYLYRYQGKFGDGGFRRLMKDGFMLTNAHYNYVPTYTGPGHASVYTGTTPAFHGIIGNDWWDKGLRKTVNCVEDDRQTPVGTVDGNGDVSPWRLQSTTITDELKLFFQKRSKIIGISLKDRGAVLPAGHLANGAYWFDSKSGKFISSTYYQTQLPAWAEKFNAQKIADGLLNQVWNTKLPIEQYTESGPDDSPYERILKGKDKPVFPYDLKTLRTLNGNFDLISSTPMGNDIVELFAESALSGEELGKDDITDFLAVSFSSTDIIGHAMGPNSVEIEDTYIRLDKNIADLLTTLDNSVGKGNYLLFLTADHAVVDVPQSLVDLHVPAGNGTDGNALKTELNNHLHSYFPGKDLVESVSNNQVFFNSSLFGSDPKIAGVELLIATEMTMAYLQAKEGIAQVYSRSVLRQSDYKEGGVKGMIVRGYHSRRSGDIAFEWEPGWVAGGGKQGTTHGSPYSYDTHVPVIFFGKQVAPGTSSLYHPITDIAPTLSVLLGIKFPSACTGQPVSEMIDRK